MDFGRCPTLASRMTGKGMDSDVRAALDELMETSKDFRIACLKEKGKNGRKMQTANSFACLCLRVVVRLPHLHQQITS